jgi:hypothetical protein
MLNPSTYFAVYNQIIYKVLYCLENLCDSCKIGHKRGKLTKHHEVVSKRDYYKLQGTKRLESQCELHNDIVNFILVVTITKREIKRHL